MGIWGKLLGAIIGFRIGGFVGAILGLAFGHWCDTKLTKILEVIKKTSNRQAVFFNSTFAVMGHMAKASGRVTEVDIRIANLFMEQMRLTGQAKQDAQQAFRDGKSANFDLASSLRSIRMISMGRTELLQMFLEIQIQIALSDGELEAKEKKLLEIIADGLGFSRSQLEQLLNRWKGEFQFRQGHHDPKQSIEHAYEVLGVTSAETDQQIKRAYRKLMNEHHPDKLIAKGLPKEMMEIANRKAQDIQTAYDRIKLARGIR